MSNYLAIYVSTLLYKQVRYYVRKYVTIYILIQVVCYYIRKYGTIKYVTIKVRDYISKYVAIYVSMLLYTPVRYYTYKHNHKHTHTHAHTNTNTTPTHLINARSASCDPITVGL